MLMSQPRIFFSMSRDRLLPAGVSKVHPKFRTPYITTIITCVIVAIVAGFVPIQHPRRDDEHRHAVRVRRGVGRGHHPAREAAGSAAALQACRSASSSRCSACCSCVYLMVSLSVMTWVRFLGLARPRHDHLLVLRPHPQPARRTRRKRRARSGAENLANFLKMLGYMLLFNGFCITLLAFLTEWGVTTEALAKWSELDGVLQPRRDAHQPGDRRCVRPEDPPGRRRRRGRRVRARAVVEQAVAT